MAKKKILLMSDDLRMHSGVATVSKDIVFETLHQYDWVQMGGAIKHPEAGKVIDMSEHLQKDFGIKAGIGIPNVVVGKNHVISRLKDVPCVVIPCECANGEFAVEININQLSLVPVGV